MNRNYLGVFTIILNEAIHENLLVLYLFRIFINSVDIKKYLII